MKYLKLTNTDECLKLAECLIGSECFYPATQHSVTLYGSDLKYGFATNPYMDTSSLRWWRGALLLPLDTLKLNLFKCMEHRIHIKHMFGVTRALQPDDFRLRDNSYRTNFSFELSCENLPSGAEIVEAE